MDLRTFLGEQLPLTLASRFTLYPSRFTLHAVYASRFAFRGSRPSPFTLHSAPFTLHFYASPIQTNLLFFRNDEPYLCHSITNWLALCEMVNSSAESCPKAACPKTDLSGNEVLRLTIKNWLSHKRTFQLERGLHPESLSSNFESHINWACDQLEFSFRSYADHPIEQEDLFQKIKNLIGEKSFLGIRRKCTEEQELNQIEEALRGRRRLAKKPWKGSSMTLYGCKSYWARRENLTGCCYFRFDAGPEESTIFMVDEKDIDYQRGARSDPVRDHFITP